MAEEMRKILWFSRHEITPAQLQELHQLGELIIDNAAIGVATRTIRTEAEADEVADDVLELCGYYGADTIAGVIPVPLRPLLQGLNWLESWSLLRGREGFRHYKFVVTHVKRLISFEELKQKEEFIWVRGSNDIVLPK